MPTSKAWGKAWIDEIYLALPGVERVLDVGVGRGTYSMRLRERRPGVEWVGVEAWEPYVDEFALAAKYDRLLLVDARRLDWGDLGRFDVVFMGDVLEHMAKHEAVALAQAATRASGIVVVSVPVLVTPQGAFGGNPFEVHVKPDWSHEEALLSLPSVRAFYVEQLNGVYLLCADERRAAGLHAAYAGAEAPPGARTGWVDRPRRLLWRAQLIARRAGRVAARPARALRAAARTRWRQAR